MEKRERNADELARGRRRRRRQGIGALLCVLAVVGVVSLVRGAVSLTTKMFDDSAEKAEYEKRLTYVVMLDMLPFESLGKANQTDLLESCLWAALFNEDNTAYKRDEVGALLLPSADVDKYAAKLFGPDYKLAHGTFESEGMVFNYDENTQCYTIPITGQVNNYTPKVVEISGTKAVKRVSVGYLAPYNSAADYTSARDTTEPVKYYDYLFTRAQDGNYYLTSMEESKWVSSVSVASGDASESLGYNVEDPNAAVNEATNAGVESSVSQEIQRAQNNSLAADSSSTDASEEENAG